MMVFLLLAGETGRIQRAGFRRKEDGMVAHPESSGGGRFSGFRGIRERCGRRKEIFSAGFRRDIVLPDCNTLTDLRGEETQPASPAQKIQGQVFETCP
jgi:hypothetical protein